MGELAVSRAFGDAPFKILDTPSEPLIASGDANIGSTLQKADVDSQLTINPSDILKGPLVICTPEITETHLTGKFLTNFEEKANHGSIQTKKSF